MTKGPGAGALRVSYRSLLAGTSAARSGTAGEPHALGGAAESDARRRDGRERHDRQC
jgi:hypothetical protein